MMLSPKSTENDETARHKKYEKGERPHHHPINGGEDDERAEEVDERRQDAPDDRMSFSPGCRPAVDEMCGRLCWLSAERLAVSLVRASPRISWTRGTRSTPDCAMGRKAGSALFRLSSRGA